LTPQPITSELNRLVGPVVLGLAVLSYIRRKQAIGGWLLFFFGEVYVAVVVGALASIPVVAAVFPGPFSPSSPNLRLLSLVVSLRLLGYLGMAVASTFLLRVREPVWVKLLRIAIGMALVLDGITLIVDKLYFPGTLVGNLGRWFVLLAWLGYFSVSVRVRMVFFSKTWGEQPVAEILRFR
jgi:hypothetical protein